MASSSIRSPRSCDTFVWVAGAGGPAGTLFGKNADRPSEEAHEVLYVPAATHPPGSTVKCTHIEIPQASSTFAVVLSRPSWMFGCEIGANERGVVGGNEAIHSLLAVELGDEPRLLGMDLLRLALERGHTAREAMRTCCTLLEAHGQGGACCDDGDGWTYENGFVFADCMEAFVVETAGRSHWAVERVGPGEARNISNGLSIRTALYACSDGIKPLCKARGWWDGSSPFDWKAALVGGSIKRLEPAGREKAGREHLRQLQTRLANAEVCEDDVAGWLRAMAAVLRDEETGICFRELHGFCTTGSQISWLPAAPPDDSDVHEGVCASHLFSAASDPLIAVYKRFGFEQAPDAESDFGTRQLWGRHRQLTLDSPHGRGVQGEGEEGEGSSSHAAVRAAMLALERDAMLHAAEAAHGAVSAPPSSSPAAGAPLSFAAAVERELAMLADPDHAGTRVA